MRCIVCNHSDKWENVDKFRLKPEGMSICSSCGFVSYPAKWKSKEEIFQHYRSAYRNPPNSNNAFTGQRKIHFHNAFLQDVLNEWKEKNIEPEVFEVGAAYGLALEWFKRAAKAKVQGSELTTTYRRNCFHEFGIDLKEDFDDSKKHDLIMSYKVAEHQLDVDLELRRYATSLKEGGYLYISVPIWFDTMTNFGAAGFDLEYYYDPNHINVWGQKHFQYLLAKAGLKIVKQDHVIYDSTFLCVRDDSQIEASKAMLDEITKDQSQYKDTMKKLELVHKAFLHFIDGKFDEAIKTFPDYPNAHVNFVEMNRKGLYEKGWEFLKTNIIENAIKCCPNSAEIMIMATDIAMRAKQWKEAIGYCEKSLAMKPENPSSLNQMIQIMREMALEAKNNREKMHYFNEGRKIAAHMRAVSAQHFRESTDMIYLFNAQIPTPSEMTKP